MFVFSLSDNFHAILSEKMCKYRKIAPENDPCYGTLCFRYSGAKKYAEAVDLLYNGSQTLLQHKQVIISPVARKPVYGVSAQARHKPSYTIQPQKMAT